MTRTELINYFIKKYNYKSYLEIGVQDYYCNCDKIDVELKHAVDPFPRNKCDYIMTSDNFFNMIASEQMYDIIFIDGLHHSDQVERDVLNSMKHLNKGGTILLHDCLPEQEQHQFREDLGGPWNGDVWKALAKFRMTLTDWTIVTIDTDCGIGVMREGYNKLYPYKEESELDWNFLVKNVMELMNVVSVNDFLNKDLHIENLSLGMLSWKSHNTLIHTLESYRKNGLLSMCSDFTIYFQEITDTDISIAKEYNVNYIGTKENVGIGVGFSELFKNAKYDNMMVLENDWVLIENENITKHRLETGIVLLNSGMDAVRYRHRKQYGDPLYTIQFKGNETKLVTHLLDCVHWVDNPDNEFSDYIQRIDVEGEPYYLSHSAYGNFTNNPVLYKKQFYLDVISSFSGKGNELEGLITKWWSEQEFGIAQGNGLFTHWRVD